jgi:hypothetical protein
LPCFGRRNQPVGRGSPGRCRNGACVAAFPEISIPRDFEESFMVTYSIVDLLAIGFFILEWTVYAITLEDTRA